MLMNKRRWCWFVPKVNLHSLTTHIDFGYRFWIEEAFAYLCYRHLIPTLTVHFWRVVHRRE